MIPFFLFECSLNLFTIFLSTIITLAGGPLACVTKTRESEHLNYRNLAISGGVRGREGGSLTVSLTVGTKPIDRHFGSNV